MARCIFAYDGPADTTGTHCLLLQEIEIGIGVTCLVPAHPGTPGQNPDGCSCSSSNDFAVDAVSNSILRCYSIAYNLL